MIQLLKLSVNGDDDLDGEEVLSIHWGHYHLHEKVTFGTNLPVKDRQEYIILVLGNIPDFCWICHIADHEYSLEPVSAPEGFIKYSPAKYKQDRCKTWFIFDYMQEIPVKFLDQPFLPEFPPKNAKGPIYEFITNRANNKKMLYAHEP